MKLIQLTVGLNEDNTYKIWINPDTIVSLSQTQTDGVINISTSDGKVQPVIIDIDSLLNILRQCI